MRNKVRSTEQKETGRDFRDIESRVSLLETLEYIAKGVADTFYVALTGAQTIAGIKTFTDGIRFAVSGAILSIFETGTWTPVGADAASGGVTATATAAYGEYVRIGPLTFVTCRLVNITTTGMTGANIFFIRGAPFTSGANTNLRFTANLTVANVTFSGFLTAAMGAAATVFTFTENTSGAGPGSIIVSDLASGTATFQFGLVYIAQ